MLLLFRYLIINNTVSILIVNTVYLYKYFNKENSNTVIKKKDERTIVIIGKRIYFSF